MPTIQVLDTHTAELIAAGEVVERPASVVKELAENAIDAGAQTLTVEIERGGISLISITDDGCGIPAGQVPVAFLRHATSKVRQEEDLESISTLGFRGEALASIASVSRVEVLTHADGQENASFYVIEGGVEVSLSEAARPRGTTFTVRDLFYNTPARMKFLKKDASEAGYITETVSRLALSHPEVAFRYIRDGKEVFFTPGDGESASAIHAVLGREFAKGLLPVAGGQPPYVVTGFVTPPRAGRGSRAMQYFYINGRFVKNRTMMAALEQAYRNSSMQGKFPGGVLFLQMPPQLVDVNVHPAKIEVRFAAEGEVFSAVYASVKHTLAGNETDHGALKFGSSKEGKEEGFVRQEAAEQQTEELALPMKFPASGSGPLHNSRPTENIFTQLDRAQLEAYGEMLQTLSSGDDVVPYRTARNLGAFPVEVAAKCEPRGEWGLDIQPEDPPEKAAMSGCFPLEEMPTGAASSPAPASEAWQLKMAAGEDALQYVGEVFSTYILAQSGGTMYVIDKHAAHERLIYEKISKERMAAGAQQLLSPVSVHLAAKEKEALLENQEILGAAGIELEDFGAGGVMVRAVPADVPHADIEGLVSEVAKGLASGSRLVTDQKTEWVIHSMACRAAMKGGEKTHPEQLLYLAQKIVSGAVPPFCPHGRPVVLEITCKELEKQFGRLG